MAFYDVVKNKIRYFQLANNLHYLLFLIVLLVLSVENILFVVILVCFLYFIKLKTRLFSLSIILLIIAYILLSFNLNKKSELTLDITTINVRLVDYKKEENYYKLKVKYNKEFIEVYYFSDYDFSCGSYYTLKGKLQEAEEGSYKYDFSYKDYLLKQGIFYTFLCSDITFLKKGYNFNSIKHYFLDYYQETKDIDTYSYISALVFATKTFDEPLKEDINKSGISHLYAISGMHIIFIYYFLKKLFKKIIMYEYTCDKVVLTILLIYTLILSSSSVTRAFLMILINVISKRHKVPLTRLDSLSISFLIMFFIQPLVVYQVGFILSFLVTFSLIVSYELLKDGKRLKELYKTSSFCYFISLGVVVNITNEINFLQLIFSPILLIVFTYIVLPLTYLSLILPIDIFAPLFRLFNNIVHTFAGFKGFTVNYKSVDIIVIVIYYIFMYFILVNIKDLKKWLRFVFSLILLLVVINNTSVINKYHKVTFIDVGQGDSTYIELAYNKGNIMIDSFGKNVDYLKSIGVNNLDYLILTHSDIDHTKTALELQNSINVKNILVNAYEDINKLNINTFAKIIPCKKGDIINLKEVEFYILSPSKNYQDDNDNSLVIYADLGIKYLFMADASIKIEDDLISYYGDFLDVDILKVGHHGSDTSTGAKFLKYTTPLYSIISCGRNNKYNFPKKIVLDNLSDSKIFITYETGNITVYSNINYYKIETFL